MKKFLIVLLPVLLVCTPVMGQQKGARDDVVYEYYESGILKSETSYTNGQKNGLFFEYYPTGIRRLELTYKNDVLNGGARWYNPDGTVLARVRIKDGQITVGLKYDTNGARTRMTDEEIAEYQAKLQ